MDSSVIKRLYVFSLLVLLCQSCLIFKNSDKKIQTDPKVGPKKEVLEVLKDRPVTNEKLNVKDENLLPLKDSDKKDKIIKDMKSSRPTRGDHSRESKKVTGKKIIKKIKQIKKMTKSRPIKLKKKNTLVKKQKKKGNPFKYIKLPKSKIGSDDEDELEL